jgi:hypothetical protein
MAKDFDIDKWAAITIEHWQRNMDKYDIGSSGYLRNSLDAKVSKSADGLHQSAEFSMLYYARFVDLGVGRGTNMSNRGSTRTKRKPKPWMMAQMMRETSIAMRLLSNSLTRRALNEIVVPFNQNAADAAVN